MFINDITFTSSADGEGLRTVVWFQGCNHRCKGCHNKHTWDITKGIETDSQEVVNKIRVWQTKNRLKELHLTFSGGEPLDQAADALELVKQLQPKSLWIYTGYELRMLLWDKDPDTIALLKLADVLVDGKYCKDIPPRQVFAGSGNQRILDMQRAAFLNLFDSQNANLVSEIELADKYLLPPDYVHSSKTRSSDTCPNCNRVATDDEPFERIRRITGYLVGTLDRFNMGKRAEEADRIKHC